MYYISLMNRVLSLGIILLFTMNAMAWNYHTSIGAEAGGMGTIGLFSNNVWGVDNNPANLGFQQNYALGLHYENRYIMNNLGYGAFAMTAPVRTGAFGLSFNSFGYSMYRESKLGLSYGQHFGDKLSFGLQFAYLQTYIGNDYGVRHNAVASFGTLVKLTDELSFAAYVFNINRASLSDYNNERIPTVFKIGLNYEVSKKVTLASAVEKELNMPAIVKVGVNYKPVEKFYVTAGMATNPYHFTFGFGTKLDNLKIGVATGFHPTLGVNPQLSLSYTFPRK